MKNKIFYFSSTGNCLYVSKQIKDELEECEIISIPKAMKEGNFEYEGDMIGFVFPLHSYGLPIIVRDFIEKIKINKDAYIFAVEVTGGGKSNFPLIEIENLLKDKGEIKNSAIIKYISNYTRMGKNPTEERAKKAIAQNNDKLQEFIKTLKTKEIKALPKRYSLIHKKFYSLWKDSYKEKDKNFNVDERCISCSMCQKICPVNNIEMVEGYPKWQGKCIDCMACINICPSKAINIGKSTQNKNRYRNPYIKAKELI